MSRVVDTLGATVAEGGLWITLRADAPGGVSLGGAETIEPGETKKVPTAIGLQLLNTQRAWRAEAPKAAEPIPPDTAPATASRRRK